jgi:hypothetical protein
MTRGTQIFTLAPVIIGNTQQQRQGTSEVPGAFMSLWNILHLQPVSMTKQRFNLLAVRENAPRTYFLLCLSRGVFEVTV